MAVLDKTANHCRTDSSSDALGRVFPSAKASLARGRLTHDWDGSSGLSETDEFGKTLHSGTEDVDKKVVDAVAKIAEKRSLLCAPIALSWILKCYITYRRCYESIALG